MVTKLLLQNFRNFEEKVLSFSPSITVIEGANGSGKTNILEALHLSSTGKSFKAYRDEEMIRYDQDIARVKARILESNDIFEDIQTDLEVLLTKGIIERGGFSQKSSKKKLMIEGVPKRRMDFVGKNKTVLFRPQDMDLVTGSPSLRRGFLDTILMQIDHEYTRSISAYEKGVRRRNKILQFIRDEGGSRNLLFFWDKLLIKNGEYIESKRNDFIEFVNEQPQLSEKKMHIFYDKSVISEERLLQYKREEVAAGTTLVGPHRDELLFQMEAGEPSQKRNLSAYGSRGEQRMAVLWSKIAELAYVERISKVKPTLLLDDIFSELDDAHRNIVTGISANQQTIMTTAEKITDFDTSQPLDIIQL